MDHKQLVRKITNDLPSPVELSPKIQIEAVLSAAVVVMKTYGLSNADIAGVLYESADRMATKKD